MASHEFVEVRLVCKADYFDPQLKRKLYEIRDKLKHILHTGRRRFALKKIQPWNSVKVTFDIPKEAIDRLRLLAIQGNVCLIELGILSVEIVGQSNTIVVNNTNKNSSTITNSKELTVSSSLNSTATLNTKSNDHHSKRVKTENDYSSSSSNNNPIQSPSINVNISHSNYSTTAMNSGSIPNSYVHDNTTHLHDSWSEYKMKLNGIHYYPTEHDMKRYETNISSSHSNTTSTTNGLSS